MNSESEEEKLTQNVKEKMNAESEAENRTQKVKSDRLTQKLQL